MKLGLAPNASNQGLQHFRPPLWRRWGWGWYSHFVAKARWDDTCWWIICDFSSCWEWRFFSYGSQDSELPEISAASACLLFRNGDILSPGITPAKLRTRIWGNFSFKDGFITALVMTLDRGENRSRRLVTRADMLMSRSMNIEVFGIEDGHYLAQAGRRVKNQKKIIGCCNEQNVSNLKSTSSSKISYRKKRIHNMRGGSSFQELFWSRNSGQKPLISRFWHVQVVLVDHERRSRTGRERFQNYTKTSDILLPK